MLPPGSNHSRSFLLAVGAVGAVVPAQSVSWTRLASSSPPISPAQFAYHEFADQLVMHGAGLNADETWTFRGATWTKQSAPLALGMRVGHGACYRSATKEVVLFGGSASGVTLADTWSWDGLAWRPLSVGGPARSFMAMAYDSGRDRIVVFGGVRTAGSPGGPGFLGDTWEWDGVSWVQIVTPVAPSPRLGAAMAYDAERKRIVLFGGYLHRCYGDTWLYDGSVWTQASPSNAPFPRATSMTWDDARKVVVLFGGFYGYFKVVADTWEWDGSDWKSRTVQGLNGHTPALPSLSYDRRRRRSRALLAGPSTPTWGPGELWSYGPISPASATPYGLPCSGSSGSPALTATSLPWVGFPVTCDLRGAMPGTVVAMTAGVSQTQWLGATLPLTLSPSACQVLASVDLAFAGRADAQGNTQWSLPLANLPALVGRSMFLQGYAADPALALGFVTSNAIDAVVGAK